MSIAEKELLILAASVEMLAIVGIISALHFRRIRPSGTIALLGSCVSFLLFLGALSIDSYPKTFGLPTVLMCLFVLSAPLSLRYALHSRRDVSRKAASIAALVISSLLCIPFVLLVGVYIYGVLDVLT